jgi:hypothetical protein
MADVQPFRALHYDLDRTGGLQAVAAPPYDVIDAGQRAELVRRSPYNVVEVDLPSNGGDPYAHAADVLRDGPPAGSWSATPNRRSGRSSRPTPAPTAGPARATASSRA